MDKSKNMAPPKKLLAVSDSVLLNQRQAQRTAYLGMIDFIAEQSGVASALVARTLQHPESNSIGLPSISDMNRLQKRAKDAVALYLTKRTEATCSPNGLAEALTCLRKNLLARGDGSGASLVGVSALAPSALTVFMGRTELPKTLDFVYSVGHPAEKIGLHGNNSTKERWIRQLLPPNTWPSPTVMKAICALHHAKPEEAVLIAGNLGNEIEPALELGMKAVYVRLGLLDKETAEADGFAPTAPSNHRRPDGIVTRLQDLPRLPIFQRISEDGNGAIPRPNNPFDRGR
jgi:hypothetical protein